MVERSSSTNSRLATQSRALGQPPMPIGRGRDVVASRRGCFEPCASRDGPQVARVRRHVCRPVLDVVRHDEEVTLVVVAALVGHDQVLQRVVGKPR